MAGIVLERIVDSLAADVELGFTVHRAVDFVTGSPEPDFARLSDLKGEVTALIERKSNMDYNAFVVAAVQAAKARRAAKLVFGGVHPGFADKAVHAPSVLPGGPRRGDLIYPPGGSLHTGEVEAVKVATEHRFSAWRCGRRFGKTSTLITLAMDAALVGKSVGYFTPTYKLSGPVFRALKLALAQAAATVNATAGLIEIEGGGSIEIWNLTDVYAGRSRKYHVVMLDEAAFGAPDLAEIYQSAIAPTLLDYRGNAIVASTPHGMQPDNFFYQVCTAEEFGYFAQYHAPSSKNPHLPADELERLRQVHHPLIFQQEFDAQFVDLAGAGLFDVSKLLQLDNEPWDTPKALDIIFAVIDSGIRGGVEHDASACVFFGARRLERQYLWILGWDAIEIGAGTLEQWFVHCAQRHYLQSKTINITRGIEGVFVEPAGLGELLLAKFPGDAIKIPDTLVARGKDGRALMADERINGRQVRLTKPAHEHVCSLKGQRLNHLVSQLASFRIGDKEAARRADDLLDCVVYGCALGFEERVRQTR
jgi:hypothetical protein